MFRSKTIWYAVGIAILSVLQGTLDLIQDRMHQAIAGLLISAGIVILRMLTTQPLSDK